MKIVVIIPTYNERENIVRLLPALQKEFSAIDHDMRVLIVDDSSPDGTEGAVRALMGSMPNVDLISGEKRGLGAAYIRGMRHVLARGDADAVFEMDADFSHDPADIPRLISAIERGADFVIGSRYVEGGSIPRDWGLLRQMNSRGGNFVARHLAGMHSIRDCTAGFRAIRTSLLSEIDLTGIQAQGYAFQVALLYEARIRDARIQEIPVHFVDRTAGESKLGVAEIYEFIRSALWLRFRNHSTLIKFGLVGISGVAVNLGFFAGFLLLGMNKYLASPIAIELSILWNFAFNNLWTFRWRTTSDTVHIRGLKFNAVALGSLAISYGTFVFLSIALPAIPPYVSQLIGIVPATFVNYFLNSYWTFKHRPTD